MKEAHRCEELHLIQKAKQIRGLKFQPKYLILPGFKFEGKPVKPVHYIADFEYYDFDLKKIVIEDVKGFLTPEYKLKKKMFMLQLNQAEATFIET